MKRKIVLLITTFLISVSSYSQNIAPPAKIMLEQANDMGEKFIAKDYAGFLAYSHPRTIEVMGGEQRAMRKISDDMKEVEKDSISILTVKFGVPSKLIDVNNELQCTIPQIMEMKVPGGKVTSTTTMIAISPDRGKKWYFLDTANYTLTEMKMLLPNLSDELYIPDLSTPSFEETPKGDAKTE